MTKVAPAKLPTRQSTCPKNAYIVAEDPGSQESSFHRNTGSSGAQAPLQQLPSSPTASTGLCRASFSSNISSASPLRGQKPPTHKPMQRRTSIDSNATLPPGPRALRRAGTQALPRFNLRRGSVGSVSSVLAQNGPPSDSGSDASSFNRLSRAEAMADKALPTRVAFRIGVTAYRGLKRWWQQGTLQTATTTAACYWYLWAVSATGHPYECT
eukprot:1373412-Pleurochrysis_carterae.AAC.2